MLITAIVTQRTLNKWVWLRIVTIIGNPVTLWWKDNITQRFIQECNWRVNVLEYALPWCTSTRFTPSNPIHCAKVILFILWIVLNVIIFLAHQSRRLRVSLKYGTQAGERPSVRPSTLSNMNVSEISRPIMIKYHLEHQWGGGLTALDFGLDRIRTLGSIATNSHRVIMGKTLWPL